MIAFERRHIDPLLEEVLAEYTIPDRLRSSFPRYRIAVPGRARLAQQKGMT